MLTNAVAALAALSHSYGANPANAVAVSTPSGQPVWLVPGDTGGCLVLRDGSSTCQPSAEADRTGFVMYGSGMPYGSVGASEPAIVGLAPDGYSSAVLHLTNGALTTVPVINGSYVIPYTDHQSWQSVSLVGRQGTVAVLGATTTP